MIFTKSQSLKFISSKLNKKLVPEFFFFTKRNFLKKKNYFVKKIRKKFKSDIIIRSSTLNEDSNFLSNAGKYDSIILRKKNFNKLEEKINIVISKFKLNDQVLIQKFINSPNCSGVVFTKDKNTNSDYYQINYDHSGRSDLITSGKFNPELKSCIIFKNSKNIPKKFAKLINTLKNLQKIFKNERLDVEFCYKNKNLFILQCRPLLGKKDFNDIRNLEEVIINLKKKFKKINTNIAGIAGSHTVLSNMSDWNPAEMIGNKPSKLALTLYSQLITNNIWAEQRSNYGYKDVRPNRLMLDLAGSPYIDLRVDLNSFLPNGLNLKTSKKIINHCINKLKKNPHFHDKIEFEIIDTCFALNLEKKDFSYLSSGEKKDYINKLKKLTNNILNKKKDFLGKELKKINILAKKIKILKKSNLSHIQKIYYLINDCKIFGTLPFAGIARCAFISKSILDSLKNHNILTKEELHKFYLSINTISKDINNKYLRSLKRKNFKKFLMDYGHLRPSTYSISNKNYNDNFNLYFSKKIKDLKFKKSIKFSFNKKKKNKINKIFKKNGLQVNFKEFINFAKKSIENREYAKLTFSKSIDEIFENLKKLSKEIGINYKDFEHIDIDLIIKSFSSLEQEKLKKLILLEINKNKKSFKFSKKIKTSDVIKSSIDFDYFYENVSKENYVTEKNISSEIVLFNNLKNFKSLNNKIVLIENADPGYDFLFSYNIKGLITKYGGANSHMAIRCMELDLPSIIGIGEKNFNNLLNFKKIYIDCNNRKFEFIH